MKKTISILGTGWLGFALAKNSIEIFNVKVSLRDKEKEKQMKDEGFMPFLLNEDNLDSLDELLDTNYLFINFPPTKSKNYLKFLENIYSHKKIKNIEKIIFISSTSIYPDLEKSFKEDFKIQSPVSKIVYEAEELIKNKTDVIFRCAGLMGYNRIAGKYFQNRVLDSQDVKVNYVHRDDVILATNFVIKNDVNGVFNLCSSFHPSRKEIYLHNASKYGFEKPIFRDKKIYKNRLIDGSKIEGLGFKYKFSNPLDYV